MGAVNDVKGLHTKMIISFDIRSWFVLTMVSASICASIVYNNIQTYDLSFADIPLYVRMYHGGPVDSWAYRPVLPMLARLVPDLPPSFISTERVGFSEFQIAFKFGLVNFFFLLGTCLVLCKLMAGFGLDFWYCLLGIVLFLGTPTVTRFGGLPMTDTPFFFFFVLCLLAMQHEKIILLVISATLGIFTKELIILCIPMALVMPIVLKRKSRILMALIPGFSLYFLSVSSTNNATIDRLFETVTLSYLNRILPELFIPHGWINLLSAFGCMWFLAVYALKYAKLPILLFRWAILVPVVLFGVLFAHGALLRGTFSAFPVMVPLAVHGIKYFLENRRDDRLNDPNAN
jgi:hypothetical protein